MEANGNSPKVETSNVSHSTSPPKVAKENGSAAASEPSPVANGKSSEEQQTAELSEQKRSIQLAYLWLKIEESEYLSLISETEKQVEQERQMIKRLAGVITSRQDYADTDSLANDDDSEGGSHLNVPTAVAGSSMALVAHDELDNEESDDDTSSDEDTHLNNTHKSVMMMRQNERLEVHFVQ